MTERPRARLLAYGVAVSVTAGTFAARLLLWPVLGDAVPHMAFFPAVMIAAYYGGLWPGLLATLLGAVAANVVFTEPHFSPGVKTLNAAFALPLFVLVGVMMSGLSESLHRARRRLVAQERRRAEEALRETEERFRQLAENIHEIFWIRDARDGRVLYVSPGYEELTGRPPQSLYDQPRSWAESLHPDDRGRAAEHMRQHQRGVFTDGEFRVVRSDGSVRWMRCRAFPIRDTAGRLSRIAGLAEDITERKRSEEALRASEQRFRMFVDHAADAFFLHDEATARVLDVNRQACESLGYARDELLGMTPFDFDLDVTPALYEEIKRKLKAGETIAFESRHRRKDGTAFPVEVRGQAFQDCGRCFFVSLARDVTDRRRAEEALRESEGRFRGTFENAAVGIAHTHPTGRFLRLNEKFCAIVGYPHEELLQKTFQDITHPDDLAASLDPFGALLRGESAAFGLEKRYLRKDGSLIWVELFVSLQRNPAGQPAYAIAVIQDISERKRLEGELRRAKELAEAANRAKDEFLANVSHEVRTPFGAILGMTELVLDTPLTDDQRQCLKTVKSAADNLLGIVNDLLDFSKIEAGKLELDPADFSLRAALGDTLRALAVRAHKKGLELACHVEPGVPDALVGDAGRLRQVLLNLVGNALKFTDEGEVVVRVEGAGGPQPEGEVGLRFSVRDTGIGIPPEKQERIFRAFEQEDTSTTRRYGGTGLGLTIASRLVALMGGTIAVESAPGQGSTFSFTARFGLQPNPPEPAPVPPPVVLHGLPVLVVDDNATNRHILQEWLRGWQMRPVAVGDAVAAMDALWHGTACGRPYALVLLDARMPDTDGLALAARIRERAELSATPVVLLTSGDRPGDLARFRELRIDAHLLKPVQPDELLETIYAVLRKDEGRRMKEEPKSSAASDPAFTLHPSPSPLRVLVAEDNELNAQLIQQLLVRRGHRVRLASNGREALALAADGSFDLLLLDLHMPEMDGFQVIQGIRERERDQGRRLPVIALTARSRKEDRERCLAAGMDEFLSKPVRAADLWAAIASVAPPRREEDESSSLRADQPGAAALGAERPQAPGALGAERPQTSGQLDPQVLLAACGDDAAILAGICRVFQAGLPGHLATVQDALRGGDAPGLREAAHKLCGMVAAFSTTAAGVASDLEDKAAEGRLGECRPLVERLEAMAGELLQEVDGLSIETLRHQAIAAGDLQPGVRA
jgi:PAS domain S-box-containing protein